MTRKIMIMDHPLIAHKLSVLRDENTPSNQFRNLVNEITELMIFEATRDLETEEVEVKTPCGVTKCKRLCGKMLAFVPILRAGIGMLDGALALVPTARVGHIGLYRDEKTMEPHEYYCKLPPDIEEREVFVVDPMLATGGSACDAIRQIKKRHPKKISFLCIVAAPVGLERLKKEHENIDIYCAALDECLNEDGYIVPGLGDAGDRIFGTL